MTSQELLETILKAFVNHPEEIKVNRKVDEMGVLYEIEAHPSDRGLIIGKKGRMVLALKQILRSVGFKTRERISIRVKQE